MARAASNGKKKVTPAKVACARDRGRRVAAEAPNSLEAKLDSLAKAGLFDQAAAKAIERQRAQGLTITYKKGRAIVRERPDGTTEVVAKIAGRRYHLPDEVKQL